MKMFSTLFQFFLPQQVFLQWIFSSIPWFSLFQFWYIQGYFEHFSTKVRMKKARKLHGGAVSRNQPDV